jgi:hypothetical protein
MWIKQITLALIGSLCTSAAVAADLDTLCQWRAGTERVSYERRLGIKQPFGEVFTAEKLEQVVAKDLHKEAVLQRAYGVQITEEMLAAEVSRINRATQAPDVLAALKEALGHSDEAFALTVAKPIVVERLLRQQFTLDNKLHATERDAVKAARQHLLSGESVDGLQESVWQLGERPEDATAPQAAVPPTQAKAKSSIYSNDATAQVAQVLTPSGQQDDSQHLLYFENLPADLQKVLKLQLKQAGDVTSVIETPAGYLIYVAREISADSLTVATLTIQRRSYEEWLSQQPTQAL